MFNELKLFQNISINAKPFLKWAGGKTQLISELINFLPYEILSSQEIENYVEPFIGGGALFFYLKNNFFVKKSVIMDINKDLILTYKTIQNNPFELINHLEDIKKKYHHNSVEQNKILFYEIRKSFNEQLKEIDYNSYQSNWCLRSAYLIFLNKTCFNGLFRQNSKGEFNVPFGGYKYPKIYDKINILEVSKALNNTEIICSDFRESEKYIGNKTLVYFDPPYRPLNKTSAFTTYSSEGFGEQEQIELSSFFKKMHERGAFLILSNSDPKNENPNDIFFETLYLNFKIHTVKASRMINCIGDKRGKINELLITNF